MQPKCLFFAHHKDLQKTNLTLDWSKLLRIHLETTKSLVYGLPVGVKHTHRVSQHFGAVNYVQTFSGM